MLKNLISLKNSQFFFKVGVFFILSAPAIASFFLLLSIFLSSLKTKENYFKNKFNIPLIICTFLLLLSATLNTTTFKPDLNGWDPYLNWVGLANWIPFFYSYWIFQILLTTEKAREKTIKIFVSGTIPLFFSGFSQIWLNLHGPFRFLNNLIVWFQRPVDLSHPYNGMTGLFSNQNYAGAWLIIIWPMLIACLLHKKDINYKKLILILLSIFTIVAVYLTRSRNAWIGTLLGSNLLINKNIIIWFLLILSIIGIVLFILNLFIPSTVSIILKTIYPQIFFTKFAELGLDNLGNYPRIFIWQNSLDLISQRPFLGWGAATFPILFEIKNGSNYDYAHPHSLILELATSYGLITSAIITLFVILILFRSFKSIFSFNLNEDGNIFEKAWWISTFILCLSQLFDIQYFDFRISVTFWILLSGLTSKIRKEKVILN